MQINIIITVAIIISDTNSKILPSWANDNNN